MGALKKTFQKFLSLPEWVLIKEAKLGDKEAFGRLYQLYVDRIFRYVYFRVGNRETAEDIVSEVFMKAWNRLDSFETGSYQAWVYMIAHNQVIDFYRSQKYQTNLSEELPSDSHIEETVGKTLEIERVQKALKYLTDEQQEVIVMKFIEDMENKEIAAVLGKKEEALRAMQHRAIQKLREVLHNE